MAQNETLLTFTPLDVNMPDAEYATLDLTTGRPVLDFDAAPATPEYVYFTSILPRSYSHTGIRIWIYYTMTSATSGDVVWVIAFNRSHDGGHTVDALSFDTAIKRKDTIAGVATGALQSCYIDFADGLYGDIDNTQPGDMFRIKVMRDTDDADDTASGDAELMLLEVMEQPI